MRTPIKGTRTTHSPTVQLLFQEGEFSLIYLFYLTIHQLPELQIHQDLLASHFELCSPLKDASQQFSISRLSQLRVETHTETYTE